MKLKRINVTATRRRFLGLFGGAAVAAPLAAKTAMDAEISRLTGIATGPLARLPMSPIGPPASQENISYPEIVRRAGLYAKTIGIPEHVLEGYRLDAKHVQALDPDIANKRSWSMAVKIQHQRERNFRLLVDGAQGRFGRVEKAEAFQLATGFYWPF